MFRTHDQTILVSVNVPAKAIEDGSVDPDEIARVLATATTTEKPAVRDLYSLSYLGPFKEAGTLVGTSKVYTLDGRLEPERRARRDRPSWWRPRQQAPDRGAREARRRAAREPARLQGRQTGEPRAVIVGDLDGIESPRTPS